ncbi:MAG TPA: homoserine acetyltransferase, partial [Xanthobacteraceae bacterium]|nr:homoserine acetyltransferase [Xanthobacteraceae bacterium]
MLKTFRAIGAVALLLVVNCASVYAPSQPPHQLYNEDDLKLESGEVIKNFSISYVTHGTLNAKKSNAILMVTERQSSSSRLHDRTRQGARPGQIFHHRDRCHCQRAAQQFDRAAAHVIPKVTIRDLVESRYRLLEEKFGIDQSSRSSVPRWAACRCRKWGVSHPDMMDSLIAMVPLAKTPVWAVAVLETTVKAIMIDPAWNGGNYTSVPEKGVRLWLDILNLLAARTADQTQFKGGMHVLPWMAQQEDAMMKAFDANNWIYQTWAYEKHDIGTTPGFDGNTAKALGSIK